MEDRVRSLARLSRVLWQRKSDAWPRSDEGTQPSRAGQGREKPETEVLYVSKRETCSEVINATWTAGYMKKCVRVNTLFF